VPYVRHAPAVVIRPSGYAAVGVRAAVAVFIGWPVMRWLTDKDMI
jgi:hypothetical protein